MHVAQGLLLLAIGVAGVAAVLDLQSGLIPNWLTLSGFVIGVVGHAAAARVSGHEPVLVAAGFAVSGGLVCALVPALLFFAGGGGGGDVKLALAIGALCRPMIGIEALFYSFLVATIFALGRLAWEGKLFAVLGRSLALLVNPLRAKAKQKPVPTEVMTWFRMGPAFAVGTGVAAFVHWGAAR